VPRPHERGGNKKGRVFKRPQGKRPKGPVNQKRVKEKYGGTLLGLARGMARGFYYKNPKKKFGKPREKTNAQRGLGDGNQKPQHGAGGVKWQSAKKRRGWTESHCRCRGAEKEV